MASDMLLLVHTAQRRYAVRSDDLFEIRMVDHVTGLPEADSRGTPYVGFDLGALLDPADRCASSRPRALVVPLRRRLIALLADAVESLDAQTRLLPMPAIVRQQLCRPWAVGAVLIDDDTVVVQIDLREVARSALLSDRSSS